MDEREQALKVISGSAVNAIGTLMNLTHQQIRDYLASSELTNDPVRMPDMDKAYANLIQNYSK